MAFYENTIIAKQDLAEKDLKSIKDKYNKNNQQFFRKSHKIEEWGFKFRQIKLKITKKDFIFTINLRVIKIP